VVVLRLIKFVAVRYGASIAKATVVFGVLMSLHLAFRRDLQLAPAITSVLILFGLAFILCSLFFCVLALLRLSASARDDGRK